MVTNRQKRRHKALHTVSLSKLFKISDFGDFSKEYFVEYEAICDTVLTHLSGTYMGLIDEKN
jgi:hypothetical protein